MCRIGAPHIGCGAYAALGCGIWRGAAGFCIPRNLVLSGDVSSTPTRMKIIWCMCNWCYSASSLLRCAVHVWGSYTVVHVVNACVNACGDHTLWCIHVRKWCIYSSMHICMGRVWLRGVQHRVQGRGGVGGGVVHL